MLIFTIYSALSLFFNNEIYTKSVSYNHKIQICTTTEFTDLEWRITLISDGNFSYMQTENSSFKNKLSIPNDTIMYQGKYERKGEMLELKKNNEEHFCVTPTKYYIKADKLYPVNINCIDSLKGKTFISLKRIK